MQTGLPSEVLLALLEVAGEVEGGDLQAALGRHGRRARADELLVALLRLETGGHVTVARGDRYRFALTDAGRARAIELGGGRPVHLRLLMADLVDFTTFTAAHGDVAAHEAARALAAAARGAVRARGGDVVKELGDGVLAWLPPDGDPLPVARALAEGCRRPDGGAWAVRAASHVGTPIRSRGDLFGADVNLVARLCAAAQPDELVVTVDHGTEPGGAPGVTGVEVRGVDRPVAVRRVALR